MVYSARETLHSLRRCLVHIFNSVSSSFPLFFVFQLCPLLHSGNLEPATGLGHTASFPSQVPQWCVPQRSLGQSSAQFKFCSILNIANTHVMKTIIETTNHSCKQYLYHKMLRQAGVSKKILQKKHTCSLLQKSGMIP